MGAAIGCGYGALQLSAVIHEDAVIMACAGRVFKDQKPV
jgi:hypothetical protein